jgi:hypothetical protein
LSSAGPILGHIATPVLTARLKIQEASIRLWYRKGLIPLSFALMALGCLNVINGSRVSIFIWEDRPPLDSVVLLRK